MAELRAKLPSHKRLLRLTDGYAEFQLVSPRADADMVRSPVQKQNDGFALLVLGKLFVVLFTPKPSFVWLLEPPFCAV